MTSTASLAALAVERFHAWIAERDAANDWPDYLRAGKINRTEAAEECGFGRSAWTQNPGLAAALAEVEVRLGLMAAHDNSKSQELPSANALALIGTAEEHARRAVAAKSTLEKRIKSLEEQNAALRAENRELSDRLRRSALAEEHLCTTGRVLPR